MSGLSTLADLPEPKSMDADIEREIKERKRRERLAASLRENLKRRKVQHRDRAKQGEPEASPSADQRR
jgi:hypothetical protein